MVDKSRTSIKIRNETKERINSYKKNKEVPESDDDTINRLLDDIEVTQ